MSDFFLFHFFSLFTFKVFHEIQNKVWPLCNSNLYLRLSFIDPVKSDINLTKRWVDLSSNSRVTVNFFLL